MGNRRGGGPGIARTAALCAVLFGLFLMHGAPATAADGCHGRMRVTLPMHATLPMRAALPIRATLPMHAGRTSSTASADAVPARPDAAQPSVARAEPVRDMGTHGELCVGTPAQKQISLPLAPLVAVIALTMSAAWALYRAWSPGGTGRRGPPGGRGLLLRVCIART
jgi:hypothetical protein